MSLHELANPGLNNGNSGALYLLFLSIACDYVAPMYGSWLHNLEKQERVSREIEKVAAILESQKNGSINGGVNKRPGWLLTSVSAKERVKKVGFIKYSLKKKLLLRWDAEFRPIQLQLNNSRVPQAHRITVTPKRTPELGCML